MIRNIEEEFELEKLYDDMLTMCYKCCCEKFQHVKCVECLCDMFEPYCFDHEVDEYE